MDTKARLSSDERSAIIMQANTWAYNFLLFALLIDVVYRAVVFDEAAWDLFALIFASGIIGSVYAAGHNAWKLTRNNVILMAMIAVVAALVAFILAMIKSV
jgi:hypothetical protein